jgi:ornithine carbamoyltransferase
MRHLITLHELKRGEIDRIFAIAEDLKSKYRQGLREPLLPGRVLALLFEKPSLRTRVSFETAMSHLGGTSLFLGEDVGWGSRESIADFARVLSEYVDAIVVRAHEHAKLLELAAYSSCPVINGLTDQAHPCQALADLFTLRERLGSLRGQTLAFVGDGNNVARSLAVGCAKLGMHFVLSCPHAYRLDDDFLDRLRHDVPDMRYTYLPDPRAAVAQAAAVYTDVWASMGQEAQAAERRAAFAAYQVNSELLEHAPANTYFMHCLPAHRGEEVTDEVIDGPRSIVVEQAANRLHVQKGILAWLLGSRQ